MEYFQNLGKTIDRAYRAISYDEHRFPRIAASILEDMPPGDDLGWPDVIRWMQSDDCLPVQDQGEFGEPSLMVYVNPAFYIQVLFWLEGTTSIHQHGFSGAFHVMDGGSIHARYDFKQGGRVSSRMLTGAIHLREVEQLRKGDTRPIESGDAFIHSLFHLERPSVTIVVRTHSDQDTLPQYNYLRPTLAVDPFFRNPTYNRQLEALEVMRHTSHPDYEDLLVDSVKQHDFFRAFRLVRQWFDGGKDVGELDRILEPARPNHGELLDHVGPVLAEERRQSVISQRRALVHDADHRYFLALLLNVPERDEIFRLVRENVPDAPAKKTIQRWVRELAGTEVPGTSYPNALGIEMDDVGLEVFELLMEEPTDDGVLRRLATVYSAEDVAEQADHLRELCGAFRNNDLFKHLLATP